LTSGSIARAALFITGAAAVWYALERTPPSAPRPAELLDASRALASWTRPDTLDSGETLERVLRRSGLEPAAVQGVISAAAAVRDMRRMPAGMAMEFVSDSVGLPPSEIILRLDVDHRLRITRADSGAWRAAEEWLPWTVDTVLVRGVVRSNLYDAMSDAANQMFPTDAARNMLVARIADVYEYRVEMTMDLRVGDSVHAVVQRRRGPEQTTRVDTVLAARLFLGTRRLEAFFFPDERRRVRYYDGVGKSLATAFLRNPIEFARISSRFNPRRFHPILRTWRAHRGTDYAAASGTPVRAIADGTVQRAVYNPGGYGNFVDVRHIGGLVTRYAHLRGFAAGVTPGARIGQKDIVGYVGMTGLATAPHLHFEVIRNGVQIPPAEALGRAEGRPLPTPEMPAFDRARAPLVELLNQVEGPVRLSPVMAAAR
jgi:murein DD-endopeptidase MepM/ murein hydrolase activator NlpD